MKHFDSKENCLKSLECVDLIFRECMEVTCIYRKLDLLLAALVNLKMFLDARTEIECPYRDVLKYEYEVFKRREVPYTDGFTGKTNYIYFGDIEDVASKVVFKDAPDDHVTLPKIYTPGNLAIGQIFIKEREAFCIKFAVEHSINSTLRRWYGQNTKFIQIMKRGINAV